MMVQTESNNDSLTPSALLSLRDEGGTRNGRRADFSRPRARMGRSLHHCARPATVLILALLLLSVPLLAGCGEKDTIAGNTPQATAEAFIEAMQAGEYDKVAAGFDYETNARRENPDWDSFGEHQRDLIVDKLQEDRARELEALAGMFTTGEASVADIQESTSAATAAVTAGANTLILRMRQIEGQWRIAGMEEQTG